MSREPKKNLILLIDDNPDDLRCLGTIIKDLGDVIFASSAKSGLFIAKQRKPDLIITDLELPESNGLDICRELKTVSETQDCSVIVLTAHHSENHEILALEAGAVDFISKPYSAPVIQARVKTHLSLSRQKNILQSLAEQDGLTEVYNRRYFDTQAKLELKRHYRQQQPLTIALLDVDYFKAYNDAYGHVQGDLCLKEVAQAIDCCTRRPGEFVARYGGEEFAVVLPNTDAVNAKKYGQWICDQILWLAIPHTFSETVPFVTISAGISTVIPDSSTTLEHIVQSADNALYRAKSSGRNQFKVSTIEKEAIQEAG